MGRRCDRDELGVGHRDLWIERGELEVLLVLLRAEHAPREREDHGIVALQVAELPRDALLVGQLVVRERAAGRDITSHGLLLSSRSRVAVTFWLGALARARRPWSSQWSGSRVRDDGVITLGAGRRPALRWPARAVHQLHAEALARDQQHR